MGGFKKESNNVVFEQNLFNLIILKISESCESLKNDCHEFGDYLSNNEDKISNRLVERYLNLNRFGIRFILQKPEQYNADTDTYKGRADITVVSLDWLFKNHEAFYIIESKRLDGHYLLNKAYVSEGVLRFVMPPLPKYSSYYGRNIMLGYIVKKINVSENMKKIDKLQRKLLIGMAIGEMELVCDDGKGFNRYQCLYQVDSNLNIELTHLCYDFSSVMA